MKQTDTDSFYELIAATGEMYGRNLSKAVVNIYWESLNRFELCDVQRALKAHTDNAEAGQFMPKPADVIKFLEGTGADKALEAWSKVDKAIRHVGSYESVSFDDKLIHAAIDGMGGWVRLCSTTMSDMPFKANEFQKRYQSFSNRTPEHVPEYLTGISRSENPVLIGNKNEMVAKSV